MRLLLVQSESEIVPADRKAFAAKAPLRELTNQNVRPLSTDIDKQLCARITSSIFKAYRKGAFPAVEPLVWYIFFADGCWWLSGRQLIRTDGVAVQ